MPPRERATRIADTRHRLEHDVDAWVATAGPDGVPGLVPLSFDWDGERLLLATYASSPAGTNLRLSGRARVALGLVRDVVMIDATATELALQEIPPDVWSRYVARTGWDPRTASGYRAYLLVPEQIQAWREVNEITGRTLMSQGRWLDTP